MKIYKNQCKATEVWEELHTVQLNGFLLTGTLIVMCRACGSACVKASAWVLST